MFNSCPGSSAAVIVVQPFIRNLIWRFAITCKSRGELQTWRNQYIGFKMFGASPSQKRSPGVYIGLPGFLIFERLTPRSLVFVIANPEPHEFGEIIQSNIKKRRFSILIRGIHPRCLTFRTFTHPPTLRRNQKSFAHCGS
jgi:hypothetical protein